MAKEFITDGTYLVDSKIEDKRLKIQSAITAKFDSDIYSTMLEKYPKANILDIGCNDGYKILTRLQNKNFKSLVGVDYNKNLIDKANSSIKAPLDYIKFITLNIESKDFINSLYRNLADTEIKANFDLIFVSMVFLHISNPLKLLNDLKLLLDKNGTLVIIDIDDGFSSTSLLNNDFQHLNEICARISYTGNRQCGRQLYKMLYDTGFSNIQIPKIGLNISLMDMEERKHFYMMCFGFIPTFLQREINKDPENEVFNRDMVWLKENFNRLQSEFVKPDFFFQEGFMCLTAQR